MLQFRNGQDKALNLLDTRCCISDPNVLRSSVPPRERRAKKSTTNAATLWENYRRITKEIVTERSSKLNQEQQNK